MTDTRNKLNDKILHAHDGEPLDSVLYRATASTNGIEELLMQKASYAEQLFFRPGESVRIAMRLINPPVQIKQTIKLWE